MKRFLRSFMYAFFGLRLAVREERNFRFHICAAIYVFFFSGFYEFSRLEYGLLVTIVAGELALELVNTSLERAVANPEPHRYELAGAVKDLAAAAVLVFSMGALVCGFFLFWDVPTFITIGHFFLNHVWAILLLILSLLIAIRFVFYFSPKSTKKKDT